MHPSEPPFLRVQFYLTAPYPCSYIHGLEARSQVAAPAHLIGTSVYSQLIRAGFRRSGDYTYRPHCSGCSRCVPVRIDVNAFQANRAQRRCIKQNHNLYVELKPLVLDNEQFDLYRRYQRSRHAGGGMDQDDSEQYAQFMLSSQVDSALVEFRDGNELVMVSVIDKLEDGLSAVYTFFDPDREKSSLGTYAVLWQIESARRLGLPYVYLGYWIEESRKMAYKSNYRPLEGLVGNEWVQVRA